MSATLRRYVADSALYLTDNGRVLCGRHCGTAAAYTGMDISGQPIELVTSAHAIEWARLGGGAIQCEDCARPFQAEPDMATTAERGFAYPSPLRTCPRFADTSWHNDLTDSISFSIGSEAFTIWIEPLDPRARSTDWGWNPEAPMGPSNEAPYRYTVCALEIEGSLDESVSSHQLVDGDPLYRTDDPAELIAWVMIRRAATVSDL